MKQKKLRNALTSSFKKSIKAKLEIQLYWKAERKRLNIAAPYTLQPLILLALTVGEEEGNKGKSIKQVPEKLTQKELSSIIEQTKAGLKALLLLPPAPFVIIMPAPALGKKNPAALCTYIGDKLPRMAATPAYASISPSVADNTLLYEALLPLAGISKRDISTTDKITRDGLVKQLRDSFSLSIDSAVVLSDGNLALFSLLNIATKRPSVKQTTKLKAVVFKLDTTKGKGVIGVSCAPMDNAINYIVYFGTGTYDKATWDSQIGGSRQVVKGLKPGELYNFIMVAISTLGEGEWANSQYANAPFN